MKKENNSFTLLKFLRVIFKPKKASQKNGKTKHVPRWMYRNE